MFLFLKTVNIKRNGVFDKKRIQEAQKQIDPTDPDPIRNTEFDSAQSSPF